MVLTDDDVLAERARDLRNLCFKPHPRFVHDHLGWNYRLTNLQAAVGVAQMERWDEFLAHKREIGWTYAELLRDCAALQLPVPATPHADNAYWVFGVVLRDGRPASEIAAALAARGVGTRPFFAPMHQQPVFRRMGLFDGVRHPVAERVATHGLYLPSGTGITIDEVRTAAGHLREVLGA